MKNLIKIIICFLFVIPITNKAFANTTLKDPIIIEVVTKHNSIEDALKDVKTELLEQKFITENMQEKGFTAKRTTGAKADYYVADVAAKGESGKITITITFVKVGTGLLKLQKVADTIKEDLEK